MTATNEMQNGKSQRLPDNTVLIAGGGPVGLLLATVLAYFGVKSLLLERNKTTTKWPKMDLTNARSMEIFRKLGLADGLRKRGVPSHFPYTVLISSGLSGEKSITQWLHPSVDIYRQMIRAKNDGSMPLEPYQRISQSIFEAWLKESCDANPLIDLRYGWRVENVSASGDSAVKTIAVNVVSGETTFFTSKFMVGCDGASSRTRTSLNIPLDGGPTPGYTLLVHFKSKDLTRLQKQGQFWHIFFIVKGGLMGGAIIAQDEVDTWTTHMFLPLDADVDTFRSEEAVYTVLGGRGEKYEIKIDEILVRSTYRPNIAVSRRYSALDGRVFLAGDSAHQNIPTGGYGMNMGIADAYDLGWKLAAVLNGHGRKGLLESYELERRPVAFMSVQRSKVHMGVHIAVGELLKSCHASIDTETEEGRAAREKIHQHYQSHDGENKDLGVEMGYRYESPINLADAVPQDEPQWTPSRYCPSTLPGVRAPHVFLRDGTAIFDLYGKNYTLVDFSESVDCGGKYVVTAAMNSKLPLKHLILTGEDHARIIWQKPLVLIRPDGHVSWRGDRVEDLASAKNIIETVRGAVSVSSNNMIAFQVSGSDEITTQKEEFVLEKMGDLQK